MEQQLAVGRRLPGYLTNTPCQQSMATAGLLLNGPPDAIVHFSVLHVCVPLHHTSSFSVGCIPNSSGMLYAYGAAQTIWDRITSTVSDLHAHSVVCNSYHQHHQQPLAATVSNPRNARLQHALHLLKGC